MIRYRGHLYRAADTFPLAGAEVDGRTVRDDVPNMSSIAASLDDYTVLSGIREVPLSAFDALDPYQMFYARDDIERTKELAVAIQTSGEISPLIVVVDQQGPYILEGGHRAAALWLLRAKAFPAVVVLEDDE